VEFTLIEVKSFITNWYQIEFDDENKRMISFILKNAVTLVFYITIFS
jgi:hypothetical protein